eukprot:CAMPEP_0202822256 /NCGR_PEP_ID=MMETSP1389-20130828/10942_1 /ASSEMBLY_ACC=CAM_ASM_000865 /TAXON_ID=302021 /ORGANISM="Rhodomonas sp., Strain CCMP768" /LENGTH=34 /DNA_ID= /DNA_START= /DNA_END= /DNA_ORIENTATION=
MSAWFSLSIDRIRRFEHAGRPNDSRVQTARSTSS